MFFNVLNLIFKKFLDNVYFKFIDIKLGVDVIILVLVFGYGFSFLSRFCIKVIICYILIKLFGYMYLVY